MDFASAILGLQYALVRLTAEKRIVPLESRPTTPKPTHPTSAQEASSTLSLSTPGRGELGFGTAAARQ